MGWLETVRRGVLQRFASSSGSSSPYRTRGDAARDRRDWAAAIDAYERHLAERPDDVAIIIQLGHAYKETRDLAKAEKAYLAAERIDPDDADLQLNLGHLYKRRGESRRAIDRYQRSWALDQNEAAKGELQSLNAIPLATPALQPSDLSTSSAGDHAENDAMVGAIDSVVGAVARGWAFDPATPDRPASVEILIEGKVVGKGRTTIDRPDVVAAGFGRGPKGFAIVFDAAMHAGREVLVDVRLADGGLALDHSPVTFAVPGDDAAAQTDRVTNARYAVAKPLAAVDGEHAIFVAYAPTGMLQPFVRRYLTMLRDEGIAVSLIVNADRPVLLDDAVLGVVASAVVRENLGYDFGAWAHMLHIEPRLYGADALYILNDSVFGPRDRESFATLIAAIRAHPADLVGPTETLERGWHIQSYFMRLSGALIASYGFQFFVNDIRAVEEKDRIIDLYEVPLARRVRDAGFDAGAIFNVDEARNPTLFAWERLLEAGYPFVKLLLLRGAFEQIKTRGLRHALSRHGFDLDLIDATLDYRTDEPMPLKGFPLLAKPPIADHAAPTLPTRPYKVAFYGPWNYDNGLGSASRGIIAGIRHADVRLNLHPIKVPFHVHKPLGPAFDILDFEGPADVAIVHLNPDSWHLLTDEQRTQIAQAKKRIGYWVWEMSHLPPAWRQNFSSVERIWAPSAYCAELFAAQDEAPVDVIPHVVPIAPEDGEKIDRDRIMSRLGVKVEQRVILFVFDGSSYLVRKNPAALVRAFGRSGLAEKGWSLLLKTKHLMDRAEEGRALTDLVAATKGVVLLDRSLTTGELSDLVAAADLYASPHSSEGFGLTVAEAMAMAKPVVATDYSGTTQFLDASCGYPVPATPFTLEEDFGHYTRGGTWGRIDEQALASTLCEAAQAVVAGDTRIGQAARARIADALSAETVGRAIAASIEAVVSDTKSVRRPLPPLASDAVPGETIAESAFPDFLTVVPLVGEARVPDRLPTLSQVPDDRDHWLMFLPGEARVRSGLGDLLSRVAATRPDVAIFHADDVALGEERLIDQIRLKPAFDLTLFAADDYIGAPIFVRASAFHELGGWPRGAGEAGLYALVLQAVERGMSIAPIAEVLMVMPDRRTYAPRAHRAELLRRSPLFAGYDVIDGRTERTLRLKRRFGTSHPAVTLCVPTRRSRIPGETRSFIERFLESVAMVDWPVDALTVIVGDDVPGMPDWATREWPFTLRRIETVRAAEEPFNYSAKMNRLWQAADSDVVVLMNDDVEARDGEWLSSLVGFAVDEGVGGVGARLLYDNGTIQHAGLVGGILGTSVHPWLERRADAPTYGDWAITQREWSMSTGAVFATRRRVLEAVGGFDEGFSLEFNDIDLCLKIRQAGYRIVYDPFAEMTHSEKASRGETVPPGEQTARFLSRWQNWIERDPALPPNMRRDLIDLTPRAGRGDWFVQS